MALPAVDTEVARAKPPRPGPYHPPSTAHRSATGKLSSGNDLRQPLVSVAARGPLPY